MEVVCDSLDIFIHDPQIGSNEATYLINETINSITKSKALHGVLVIVSLSYNHGEFYHHRDKLFMLYSKTIFPRFDKCIEIMNGKCKEKK